MKKFILIIATLAILISCSDHEDYHLTLNRIPYDGDELRIDGYYYFDENFESGETIRSIYFLYSNGIILYGHSFENKTDEYIEKFYSSGEFYRKFSGHKTNWGVFQIKSNELIFEKWLGSEWPEAHKFYATILNDTTFKVNRFVHSHNGTETEFVRTYHFRQFDHKPDSTNNFIK